MGRGGGGHRLSATPAPPLPAALAALTDRTPALVVFLRDVGCTFTREALADLRAARPALARAGVELALVHRSAPALAAPWLARHALQDVTVVPDPAGRLYEAFGLGQARGAAWLGPAVLTRWLGCALGRGHGFGRQPASLVRQLPGVFLVHRGRILRAHRHRTTADRPAYVEIATAGGSGVTIPPVFRSP